MWRFLRHPNVLPLMGALMSGNWFAMVSEWMPNGNINQFVKAHPEVNRLRLVRPLLAPLLPSFRQLKNSQLAGVPKGLIYLHGNGMVHGDLKGVSFRSLELLWCLTSSLIKANILVDGTGQARLADFGLLTIVSDPANVLSSSPYTQGGSVRWMSPELIDAEHFRFERGCPTKASDCYALGMVIYEAVSGKLPFHRYTDLTAFVKAVKGKHPRREPVFKENLWRMLKLCWAYDPNDRPSIGNVLRCLEAASNSRGSFARGRDAFGARIYRVS